VTGKRTVKAEPLPGSLSTSMRPRSARDLLADRQAQAGSLSVGLGGEERFEDVPLHFRRHARSGVADPEDDVAALGARLHLEAASIGHRIHRVRHQVREQVPDQAGIGAHGYPVHLPRHLDALSRLHSQGEIQRLLHQRHQLHRLGRRGESARLVEEAADDLRHPRHLALQHRHLVPGRIGQIRTPREELEVSAQGIQRIAQLVPDGAGELTERREPLLGGEIAARRHQQLVQLLEVAVLLRQLRCRFLDLPGQLRVEAADLRQHPVEPAGQI
jgi:hypothetical protein